MSVAFLIWSTGVFIFTFLVFPVQENKSAELSLEFFSSVPLAEG
ncbi:hypothetical protein [cyanobacterium endosymbiont of Rhopalodia gibberula]|nr:hypothetical protein [cyanobacterium endosymbiont of Rhopalodia gibberula]